MNEPLVIEQHYHRNGSGGDGFVVSLITEGDRTMLSISFFEDEDALSVAQTATLDLDLAADRNIRFGPDGNSHRAEYYGPIVAAAWKDGRAAVSVRPGSA